ncbi:MAG: glutathione S-transferase family protein, partial [Rhodospirillaceae bacterium]|nr:glutathione S-transferase family protein [Rhodospirillaceae bacterium]
MSGYKLIVGSKNYSSWSLRGWLSMRQSGAPFEEIVVPFHTEKRGQLIREHSPSGLVPVLLDGDLLINDSLAIAEYLAERHPPAGLWPEDTTARAVARAVAAEMHSGFGALRSALPMNFRLVRKGPTRSTDVDADVRRIEAIWRDSRSRFAQGGPFLFGEFCTADAMYAPAVSRLRTYSVDVAADSQAYMDAVWAHPWMMEWGEAAAAEPAI